MINIYKNENNKLIDNTKLSFNKNSYIVELDDNMIGFFNIINLFGFTSIEYELLEKYQNQGLGNRFYKAIEEYIINNLDFNDLLLMIKYDNIKSTTIAINNGYKIDYDLVGLIRYEGALTMHNPYVKIKSKIKNLSK